MKYLMLAAGAALALGTAAYAAPTTGDKPACDTATSECPTQEYGPYRRSDLQPGDCGASGLDCALPQFGPFRRI